jgi:hypothetical protein
MKKREKNPWKNVKKSPCKKTDCEDTGQHPRYTLVWSISRESSSTVPCTVHLRSHTSEGTPAIAYCGPASCGRTGLRYHSHLAIQIEGVCSCVDYRMTTLCCTLYCVDRSTSYFGKHLHEVHPLLGFDIHHYSTRFLIRHYSPCYHQTLLPYVA